MFKPAPKGNRPGYRSLAIGVCLAVAVLLLAGCAPTPTYTYARPGAYGGPAAGNRQGGARCFEGCGYVRQINEVKLNNHGATLGTVIGAIAGGLLGSQVGGGSGQTIATIAGAVGGGVAGHAVGKRTNRGNYGWQVVVQLNDGRYATVTESNPPQVRVGDYVVIKDDQVYRLR